MADEKPIWRGNVLGATVEIVASDDGWRIFEVSGGPRRELGDEWKPMTYSAAVADLAAERTSLREHRTPSTICDNLRAENEALASTIETFNRCALVDRAELEALRERLAKLEALGPWIEDNRLAQLRWADEAETRGDVNHAAQRALFEARADAFKQVGYELNIRADKDLRRP